MGVKMENNPKNPPFVRVIQLNARTQRGKKTETYAYKHDNGLKARFIISEPTFTTHELTGR